MSTGYATIITPIDGEGHGEALKLFLRTEVEPRFNRHEPREILKCRPRFPFDKIASLHFCSFAVLDGDAEFPPCLVFEATFDGSADGFLDALLQVAPGAIDEIYRHCEGYPASGHAIPELVKNYLARHDKGAHAFYLGSPGRTVAQIKGEAQTRDALASSVSQPWSRHKAMPATFAGILQELGDIIRNEPGHRWAQQMAAVPWEVAWRKAVPVAAVLPVLGAACLLGVLVIGFEEPTKMISTLFSMMAALIDYLHLWTWQDSDTFGSLFFPGALALIGSWAGLRFADLVLRFLFKDPRRQSFLLRVSFHFLIILRYFFLVFFVWLSVYQSLVLAEVLDVQKPLPLKAILILIGAGLVFLLFQHWATSLKLAVQFKELEPAQETLRRWAVDMLRVGMVVIAAFALFLLPLVLLEPALASPALMEMARAVPALIIYGFVG